jgi:tRNA-2-methylthio-N6-dimethylallyladenosine synthase
MERKVYIRTFGCQMNKNDSDIIAKLLQSEGFAIVQDRAAADIFIVNTCSVRSHAERRALGFITSLKPWRRERGRVLAVVGCMAQRMKSELLTRFPYVDLVLGPDSYRHIGQDIQEIFERGTRVIRTGAHTELYAGIGRGSSAVRDYVSITRGCSNFCSYCVVPYVRGPVRSRDPGDILREASDLVSDGVQEIILLGQNVNEYRFQDIDFAMLLGRIAAVPGLKRLRFLTSHPKDFNDSIVDAVESHPNICEWFHLPLQSGNDRVLGLMNRRYTVRDYRAKVESIRRRLPAATVTTDVIVGFPTETDEEYRDTLSLVEELRFDDAYTYRYSPRPGTDAERLETLPEGTIVRRLENLIAVQSRIGREKMSAMVGRDYEVLFEEKAGSGALGRTRGNTVVLVEEERPVGSIAVVRIKEVRGRTPVGAVLTND